MGGLILFCINTDDVVKSKNCFVKSSIAAADDDDA